MSFLKFDTHVHTAEVSRCAHAPARVVVRLYKKAGYDGIIITDHMDPELFHADHAPWPTLMPRYLQGYKEAKEEGDAIGLRVLLGMELRFTCGNEDYLVYGLDEKKLLMLGNVTGMTPETFRPLADTLGLLVIQAHPFRPNQRAADPAFLDGVETMNGNPRHLSANEKALGYALEHHLLQTSGSDTHEIGDVGSGGVWLPDFIHTSADFVNYLKHYGSPQQI